MLQPRFSFTFLVLFAVACFGTFSYAQSLQPAGILGDHSVLQRDKPIFIFGQATPGMVVSATFDNQTKEATVSQEGEWEVRFDPLPAGGPYELTISDDQDSLRYTDVMVGDVWIASGQSNMQYKLGEGVLDTEHEIENAQYPAIRYFEMAKTPANVPQKHITPAPWLVCTPENAANFSAVAYFFARKVYQETGVPIGIIDATWGGSSIEAWMSPEALQHLPHLSGPEIPEVQNGKYALSEYNTINEANAAQAVRLTDSAFAGLEKGVTQPSFDDTDWKTTHLKHWQSKDRQIYWFRKHFTLSEKPQDSVQLHLGVPGSLINVYLNGEQVFQTKIDPARTTLAPEYFQQGENLLVFRLANPWWNPYLLTDDDDLRLLSQNGQILASLDSGWRYSNTMEEKVPTFYSLQNVPSALYHGMMNPLFGLGIAGVIWYQGENNGNEGLAYQKLFPTMISEWRIRFEQGYFPFLFVQLANLGEPTALVEPKNGWPFLREAQDQALYLPYTGMATAIDVGNPYDIHPKDKKTVGERLALDALKITYGKEVVNSGPRYQSHTVEGAKVMVNFDNADGLHTQDDQSPTSFALAGDDQAFYPASARISAGKVVLEASEVSHPVAVRYAWARNPVINLYNKAQLPTLPFRTDDWPPIE